MFIALRLEVQVFLGRRALLIVSDRCHGALTFPFHSRGARCCHGERLCFSLCIQRLVVAKGAIRVRFHSLDEPQSKNDGIWNMLFSSVRCLG